MNYVKERFVKVNGMTYFESELEKMSDRELKQLISECNQGIGDIERKKADYIMVNEPAMKDNEHYKEVVSRFTSASVYLQADVILIDNILKTRDSSDKEYDWLNTFYELSKSNMATWKFLRFKKLTSEKMGFDIGR